MVELDDGYKYQRTALRWIYHIENARDVFRESKGGLYDVIKAWVVRNNLGEGTRIIDVCCGQGITSKIASTHGASVVGVDISTPLIKHAKESYGEDPNLSFWVGGASCLERFSDNSFDGGMMINGIFHLPPAIMRQSLKELSRVVRGPMVVTTVNPEANDFFATAFRNQRRADFYEDGGVTPAIMGDPVIAGPNGTVILLENVPFVMHPRVGLLQAMQEANLNVADIYTFGPASLAGGPEGLDLFVAIEMIYSVKRTERF